MLYFISRVRQPAPATAWACAGSTTAHPCRVPPLPQTPATAATTTPVRSNLTLRGLPGRFTELDFAYVRGAVSLCAGCTLRLVQLTLTNGQRLVSLSFFKGRPRSRVVVEDCFVTQLVCAPWDVAFDGVRDAPRSTAFPAAAANGSQARSQDVSLVQSTFRVRTVHCIGCKCASSRSLQAL